MLYVVDALNIVIDVDGDWDAAAASAEGGAGAMRAHIVGRPLESFMAGDATKMFVRAALDAARLLGETRSLPYRCDSPDERRRFEMVISPLTNGRVQVAHHLISAEPRAGRRRAPGNQSPPIPSAGWRCSQCLMTRLVGSCEWSDAELGGTALLATDVCPACAARLFDSSAKSQE